MMGNPYKCGPYPFRIFIEIVLNSIAQGRQGVKMGIGFDFSVYIPIILGIGPSDRQHYNEK
jgi:hypothetical protein